MFDIGLSQDDLYKKLIDVGISQNQLVYDMDAKIGIFTKRLISLMKVQCRRSSPDLKGRLNTIFVPSGTKRFFSKEFTDNNTLYEGNNVVLPHKLKIFGVDIEELDGLRYCRKYNFYYFNQIHMFNITKGVFGKDGHRFALAANDKFVCFGLDINNPLDGVILGSF